MTSKLRKLATAAAVAAVSSAAVISSANAETARSGDMILLESSAGTGQCTLNSVAKDSSGTSYGVTAGHCFQNKPTTIRSRNGALLADAEDIAAGSSVYSSQGSKLDDFAYFRLDESVTPDSLHVSSKPGTQIAAIDNALASPVQRVGGYIPVNDLRIGEVVCKDGSMTGRTCGVVLDKNDATQEVFALIPAIPGDSGSPLHVTRGGQQFIVGTLSGGSPVLFNLFDGTREHTSSHGLS